MTRATKQQTDPIDMSQARRYIRQRYKKTISLCSLWRYAVQGQRGVRLEHIRVGRKLMTTRQDIDKYFRNLADAAANILAGQPPEITSARHDAAERELDAAGV